MNRARSYIAGALVAGSILFATPVAAAPRQPAPLGQQRLDDVKAKVDAAIQRRLEALAADATLTQRATHLSDADRTALTNLVSNDQSGLTALKAKIDADADLATLVADARKVVDDYRVFALVEPQVHLTIASDRGLAIVERFGVLGGKLQTAIDAAKQRGKDVTAAQASLDDMNAKSAAAADAVRGIPGEVLALTPSGYPGNVDTLRAARSSLGTARDDLQAARADAAAVVSALG